ncbi:MAG: cupin domain-containing protein [Myxococcota bacterium]
MTKPRAGIEELLAGDISVARFTSEFWEQKALLLQGQPHRLQHLFSEERLHAYLKAADFPRASHLLAYFDRHWNTAPVGQGATVPTFAIGPEDAVSAYQAGATVGVFKLEAGDQILRALCRGLRVGLGLSSEPTAAALWSPDQRGFGPHFDCIGTTILQLEGAKKWRYATIPAVPWPVSNAALRGNVAHYFEIDDRTDPWERQTDPRSLEDWTEVTLTPGDVLFLPPGFWHTASAAGRSLAITIQTQSTRAPEFFANLWRHQQRGSAWDRVPPLLAQGGLHGGLNQQAAAYLEQRVAELEATIARWRADPAALLARWAALEATADPAPTSSVRSDTLVLSETLRLLSAPDAPCLLVAAEGVVHRLEGAEAETLRKALVLGRLRRSELASADAGAVDALLARRIFHG